MSLTKSYWASVCLPNLTQLLGNLKILTLSLIPLTQVHIKSTLKENKQFKVSFKWFSWWDLAYLLLN